MDNFSIIISIISNIIVAICAILTYCKDKSSKTNNINTKDLNFKLTTNVISTGGQAINLSTNIISTEDKTVNPNINAYITLTNLVKYDKVCNATKSKSSNSDLGIFVVIFIGLCIISTYLYFKAEAYLDLLYLIAYIFLSIVCAFSPQVKKNIIVYYIINFILLILTYFFSNQSYWPNEFISLYSEFVQNYSQLTVKEFIGVLIKLFIDINNNNKILVLVSITSLYMIVCISTFLQLLIHIFIIVFSKIRGISNNIIDKLSYVNYILVLLPLIFYLVFIIIMCFNKFIN